MNDKTTEPGNSIALQCHEFPTSLQLLLQHQMIGDRKEIDIGMGLLPMLYVIWPTL